MQIKGCSTGFRAQFPVDWPHSFSSLCLKLLTEEHVLVFILVDDSDVWFAEFLSK